MCYNGSVTTGGLVIEGNTSALQAEKSRSLLLSSTILLDKSMRVWYIGCASAFQADEENSNFSTRSIRPLRIMASMPDSHSGDKSSILLGATIYETRS